VDSYASEDCVQSNAPGWVSCGAKEQSFPPVPTIIFVHPPRTAGSTLSRIIHCEYDPRQICDIDDRFYFWSFQRVTSWPAQRLADIKAFNGHIPFGLHRYLPQDSTYITILRDPINRTISEYYARRHRRWHPIADRDAKRLTLKQYVETIAYNNPQTKAIAGIWKSFRYHYYSIRPSHDFYSAYCTREDLELAKYNLSKYFSLVGLTERFDETLALAKIVLGWQVAGYTCARENPMRLKERPISAEETAAIAEHNRFDLELYRFGASLFEKALRSHAQRLGEELDNVRAAKLSTGLNAVAHRVRSVIRRHRIRLRCASW
jgi:hypothetical protein